MRSLAGNGVMRLLPAVVLVGATWLFGFQGWPLYPSLVVLLAFRPVHAGGVVRTFAVLVVVAFILLGHIGSAPHFEVPWDRITPDWQPGKAVVSGLHYVIVYVALALVMLVVLLPLLLAVLAVMTWENRARQRIRDRRAERIVDRVPARPGGRPPRFSLYLRPFATSDRLGTSDIGRVSFSGGNMETVNIQTDFEAYLAGALPASRPLIAAGRPGILLTAATDLPDGHWAPDIPGIGKFPCTEENWRERVTAAARAAELIVVIPLDFPGTQWELQWLHENGLLSKCVFLMPPTRPGNPGYEVAWRQASAALSGLGVKIPGYRNNGALFAFKAGDPVVAPLMIPPSLLLRHHVRRLRRAIRR
jgi:hypothetical protein